jgi:hypothetical protein
MSTLVPHVERRSSCLRCALDIVSSALDEQTIRTPLPPEGERGPLYGANCWKLPRDFSLFGSSRIASIRIDFREVLPFCCHGRFLGRAFMLPERILRRMEIWNKALIVGPICPTADAGRIPPARLAPHCRWEDRVASLDRHKKRPNARDYAKPGGEAPYASNRRPTA